MALPITVSYTFATATSSIPLSQLDSNFTTVVNGINGIGNGTNSLSNVSITGGNAVVTTANATTVNTSTLIATTGNVTTVNATTLNAATHRSDTSLTLQTNGTTTAMTIDTSQNVGIGTSSPGYKLQAYGTGLTEINVSSVTSGNARVSFWAQGAAYNWIETERAAGALTFNTNSAERMRIDSSGNVGIGTSSPSTRLHVAATDASGPPALRLQNTTATTGKSWQISSTNAGLLQLATIAGVADYLTVDTSGNVGIGTSSPACKLDVVGSFVRAAQSDTSDAYFKAQNSAGSFFFLQKNGSANIYTPTSQPMIFDIAGEKMRIDVSGNLLVGHTTTPTSGTNTTNNVVVSNDIPYGSLLIGTNASFLGRRASDGSTILNTGQASIIFSRGVYGSTTTSMSIDTNGNVIAGASAALATTATNGFLYVPTCAGTPTGTPTAVTGMAPIVVNTTNNKLYFYSGGAWRDAGP